MAFGCKIIWCYCKNKRTLPWLSCGMASDCFSHLKAFEVSMMYVKELPMGQKQPITDVSMP